MAEEEPDAAPLAAAAAARAPEEPQLLPWVAWIWRCWHRLHDERPTAVRGYAAPMGGMLIRSQPGRIPWTAVAAWCARHGYGAEQEALLEAGLAAMDDEYLAWWAEQARREAQAGSG